MKRLVVPKMGALASKDPTLFLALQELANQVNQAFGRVTGPATLIAGTSSAVTVQNPNAYRSSLINVWYVGAAGPSNQPSGFLFSQTANSTTTANSLTSLFGTGSGSLSLPGGFLAVGGALRLTIGGYVSTADGGAGTKTFTIKLGGTAVATGASGATFTTVLNNGWAATATIVCLTTGASGTVRAGGQWQTMIANAAPQHVIVTSTSATTVNTLGALAVDALVNNGNATGVLATTYALLESVGLDLAVGSLSAPTASRVDGKSFVIHSSNAADTSVVGYEIINS